MSDTKKLDKQLSTEILLADVMLRLTALETLLIEKGILNQLDLNKLNEELAKKVSKAILEKVNNSMNLNEFITSLENKKNN